jgi:hypothetical protein
MTTHWPTWVAHQMVGVAVRSLPVSQRERYRQEFNAELHFIPPADQLRYASQVLTRTWSLRAALTDPTFATIGEGTVNTIQTRPLSCRLHLKHHWRRCFTEDGARYTACANCGKQLSKSWLGTNLAPDRWFR